MIAGKCTQCGASINVDETKEAGICEYCGTAFITEKVINNYNITNNLNISNATINVAGVDIDNLFVRAKQHEDLGDYEKAKEYYNRILDIDANNEIAKLKYLNLSTVYIGNIPIKKEKFQIVEDYLNQGNKLEAIKKVRDLSGLSLRDAKNYVENFYNIDRSKPQNISSLSSQPSSSGGCYIATCVYGSYDCPQVWTLRRYRDNILASTWYGRAFIYIYYAISPKLVKLFGHTEWFKNIWHKSLDRIVNNLHAKGFENTPYNDKQWHKKI